MKTFQQPLTAGEEAYYIRLLREGTVEESRQAREILVERNLAWWHTLPKNTRMLRRTWRT